MTIGRVVKSKAGHDKGRLFVVVGIVDDSHVLICDGRLRPLNKPKIKKLKHLSPIAAECMQLDNGVLDAHIRKHLKQQEQ